MIPPLVVLAGGFGTRLRAAVPDVPKALAPIGDTPFLALLLDRWLEQGVRDFVFTLHHQADYIQAFVEHEATHGRLKDRRATIVIEDQPLGTGGAVLNAMHVADLTKEILVANADTWLDTGLAQLAAAPAPAVVIVENPDGSRFGSVELEDDAITGFAEKSARGGSGWINGGVYKLSRDCFPQTPGQAFSIEQDVFPALAQSGRLKAVRIGGDFIDIGVPADYARFCERITLAIGHP